MVISNVRRHWKRLCEYAFYLNLVIGDLIFNYVPENVKMNCMPSLILHKRNMKIFVTMHSQLFASVSHVNIKFLLSSSRCRQQRGRRA